MTTNGRFFYNVYTIYNKYGLVTGRNILWGSRSCFTE